MVQNPSKLVGALSRDPRQMRPMPRPQISPPAVDGSVQQGRPSRPQNPNAPMRRLSPGVYRSAGGGLVTQGGRPLPRPQQQQRPAPPQSQQPSWGPLPAPMPQGMTPEQLAGAVAGIYPGQRQPAEMFRKPFVMPQQDANSWMNSYKPMPMPSSNSQYDSWMSGYGNQQMPQQAPQGVNPDLYQTTLAAQQAFGGAMGQQQQYNQNNPPQPGMQMQYGMTGEPMGWGQNPTLK